jgi:hypothetical protein
MYSQATKNGNSAPGLGGIRLVVGSLGSGRALSSCRLMQDTVSPERGSGERGGEPDDGGLDLWCLVPGFVHVANPVLYRVQRSGRALFNV